MRIPLHSAVRKTLSSGKAIKLFALFLLAFACLGGAMCFAPEKAHAANSYLEVGAVQEYGGYTTNWMWADGKVAYCGNPSSATPPSGSYAQGSFASLSATSNDLTYAIMFYGYGGPGFDRAMWPSTWYDGRNMGDGEYLALTHINISDRFAYDSGAALYGCNASFKAWWAWNITGFPAHTNAYGNGGENNNSYYYKAVNKWHELPSATKAAFKASVYILQTGHSTQDIVTWNYNPGKIEVLKRSTNSALTTANNCYSLAGARFTVYENEGCTNSVTTMTTNVDGWAITGDIAPGDYWVKETRASTGFALNENGKKPWKVRVAAGATVKVNGNTGIAQVPQSDPARMWARKLDVETGLPQAQGNAALKNAEFTIKYYGNYYSTTNTNWISSATPKATWVVKTDEKGVALLGNEWKISGSDLYYNSSGAVVIPLGTLTIQETKAPQGYLLGNQPIHIRQVTGKGTIESVSTYNAPTQPEQIIRGGVSVLKLDKETQLNSPLGGARVDGAVFDIITQNPNPVIVDGTTYSKGQVVKTITTTQGMAATASNTLPFGNYELREVSAPEGYLGTDKVIPFSIAYEGVIVELRGEKAFDNQVKRGDFEFVKIEDVTMNRMAHIPFSITSKTTGESHVIITDDNGYASTHSDWNPHSRNTNQGKTDEDGVWFGLTTQNTMAPVDDSLGALPYDTYTIKELPCSLNEGKKLVSFEVVIKRDMATVNLGTITNDFVHEIRATKSEAVYNTPLAGAHLQVVRLIDNHLVDEWVSDGEPYTIHNIVAGQYQLIEVAPPEGYAATREPLLFTVFENQPVTEIELSNEPIPSINTTALDKDSESKHTIAKNEATIIDTVSYENLVPGKEYTFTGTLMNKETGEPLLVHENPVTTSLVHVPAEPDGSLAMEFTCDASALADSTVVVFQEVFDGAHSVTVHADIENEQQTVEIVGVYLKTTATNQETGEKYLYAQEESIVLDTVTYENLVVGKEYTLKGILMSKTTGKPLLIGNTTEVVAYKTFVPEEPDGTIELAYTLNTLDLQGEKLVVFEELYDGEHLVATHADIHDEGQTVEVVQPSLKTKASDKASGTKNVEATSASTVVDTITYNNLAPGKTYRLEGLLMDASSDQPLFVDELGTSLGVTASKEFAPDTSQGETTLEFSFDSSALAGKRIVVFEKLYDGERLIAAHEDINDEHQTVLVIDTPGGLFDKTGNFLLTYAWVFVLLGVMAGINIAIGIFHQRKKKQVEYFKRKLLQ